MLTVACVASQLKVTRQIHAKPRTVAMPQRTSSPQGEHSNEEDTLGEVEDAAHRVADIGVIPHGDREARRAGGRHEERQHHEGNNHEG